KPALRNWSVSMRALVSAVVVAAFALAPFQLQAEEKAPSARLDKIVAPYVDGQTVLAMHTDLMAFDVPETIELVAKLFAWPDHTRDFVKAQAAPIDVVTQALPSDATVDIFLLANLVDISRLPFYLVLPLNNTTPASAIAGEARRDIEREWQRPVVSEAI